MVNEPFNTLPGSSALPPDKTGVTICIEEFTFNGKIHHMPQQRILDALNRGIVAGQPRASKDFVRITEADVYNRDGKKVEQSIISYISKPGILFVIDREGSLRRSEAVKNQLIGYPIRSKKKVRVRIHMPRYVLDGIMYTENWQKLDHLLETDDAFLPLTDVIINPPICGVEENVGFVAVNKAKIIFVMDTVPEE